MFAKAGDLMSNIIFSEKNLPLRRKYSAGSNPSCRADGARPKSPVELTIETCKRGGKINREISNLIPIENDISIFAMVKFIVTKLDGNYLLDVPLFSGL